MKIRPVRVELCHAEGRTDRYNKADSRLLAYEDGTDSVPKRRLIKFRRRRNHPEENIQQADSRLSQFCESAYK
jgi:hypothetical protein